MELSKNQKNKTGNKEAVWEVGVWVGGCRSSSTYVRHPKKRKKCSMKGAGEVGEWVGGCLNSSTSKYIHTEREQKFEAPRQPGA